MGRSRPRRSGARRRVAAALVAAVASGVVAASLPSFVRYGEAPVRSEAVVLLLGPELDAREATARRLVAAGFAPRLFVPAHGRSVRPGPSGGIPRVVGSTEEQVAAFEARKARGYGAWFEDTHVELLEARRMLAEAGVRSAIVVSSSWHLGRVRRIGDAVFAGRIEARYVAAGPVTGTLPPAVVAAETAKTVWWYLYAPWAGDGA